MDDTGMLGPRRADGGLPETNFLKPIQGGILIDTGVDVGISFEGIAPEIGPFEILADPGDDNNGGGDSKTGAGSTSDGGSGCFLDSIQAKYDFDARM